MASQCSNGRLFYVLIQSQCVTVFGLKYEAERAWERAGCEGEIKSFRFGARYPRIRMACE